MKYFSPLGTGLDGRGEIIGHVFISMFLQPISVKLSSIDSSFIRKYSPKEFWQGGEDRRYAKELADECFNMGEVSGYLLKDLEFEKELIIAVCNMATGEWGINVHDFKDMIMKLIFKFKIQHVNGSLKKNKPILLLNEDSLFEYAKYFSESVVICPEMCEVPYKFASLIRRDLLKAKEGIDRRKLLLYNNYEE